MECHDRLGCGRDDHRGMIGLQREFMRSLLFIYSRPRAVLSADII